MVEEGTEADFTFFTQLHHVLQGRTVVSTPVLLEIDTQDGSNNSESASPFAQAAISRHVSRQPSTPEVPIAPTPAVEEVEAETSGREETHSQSVPSSELSLPGPSIEQSSECHP